MEEVHKDLVNFDVLYLVLEVSLQILVVAFLLLVLLSLKQNEHILKELDHDGKYFGIELLVHRGKQLLIRDFLWSLNDVDDALLQKLFDLDLIGVAFPNIYVGHEVNQEIG